MDIKFENMKKISLIFLTTLLSFSFAISQVPQTAESLLKDKEKSDADIKHKKKMLKSATWEKRAGIFLDMAQFNTKGLYKGMAQKGLQGAETFVGKPNKIETKGNDEIWIYDRTNLTFTGGILQKWEETKPIIDNAIEKSVVSYKKAFELDEKGKIKKKAVVMQNIATLRDLYTNEGIELSAKKEYLKAVKSFENALELSEYPKMKGDTIFKTGLITYYTAVFAQNGKDLETAKKYFNICVEKSYEKGSPYHGLASIYSAEKDEKSELDILNKGFKKYPDSKELLFDYINYYLRIGNSEGAFESIEKAIKVTPDNHSLYFAKGTLYDEMIKDTTDKYSKEEKSKFVVNSKKSYEKALEIKPDYFNALFNLGIFYYNEAAAILKIAGDLPLNQKAKYETEKARANEQFKLSFPYLEKASEIKADEMTLNTLSTIYRQLGMYEKNKEVKEKLENLPKGGL
jgi:tetratricopeptide (TPR) repeat protein